MQNGVLIALVVEVFPFVSTETLRKKEAVLFLLYLTARGRIFLLIFALFIGFLRNSFTYLAVQKREKNSLLISHGISKVSNKKKITLFSRYLCRDEESGWFEYLEVIILTDHHHNPNCMVTLKTFGSYSLALMNDSVSHLWIYLDPQMFYTFERRRKTRKFNKLFAIFPDYITFLPPHLQLTADTIQIGTWFE